MEQRSMGNWGMVDRALLESLCSMKCAILPWCLAGIMKQ